MRFVVLGAGAMGAVVGARLLRAGFGVTLIARGAHLEAMQRRGLRVESPAGVEVVPVAAVAHPRDLDWDDHLVVFLAVKSQHTDEALRELSEVAPPHTAIVCLQNGVANEPAALRLFANVYGVSIACPTSYLEPGVVRAWSSPVTGILDIGRFPSGNDAVGAEIVDSLRAASFDSRSLHDIRRWKYRRLLSNLGNAIEAVCGPGERRGLLEDMLLAEGEAALSAAMIDVASAEEDRVRRSEVVRLGTIAGRSRPGGSAWQSLTRGTGDIETDYLNGEIVLLGRLHEVPTPANELLQRRANALARTRNGPGATSAATILELLHGR